MQIEEAQRDMRSAYVGGATGVIASAFAWWAATAVAMGATPRKAVLTLFVAGMFIYPLSVALSKLFRRSGAHAKTNPLAPLAMETTVWLLCALPLAYIVSLYRLELFFPAMMLVIGGRYLTFATLYGLRVYWALGGALAATAWCLTALQPPAWIGALAGAALESLFVPIVLMTERSSTRGQAHTRQHAQSGLQSDG
jgi:hypothetical protein